VSFKARELGKFILLTCQNLWLTDKARLEFLCLSSVCVWILISMTKRKICSKTDIFLFAHIIILIILILLKKCICRHQKKYTKYKKYTLASLEEQLHISLVYFFYVSIDRNLILEELNFPIFDLDKLLNVIKCLYINDYCYKLLLQLFVAIILCNF